MSSEYNSVQRFSGSWLILLFYYTGLTQPGRTNLAFFLKQPGCTNLAFLLHRVDTNVAAAAASGADDLDIAMGTLMAYGGKYLREIALSAWEYGTQTQIGKDTN